MLPDKMCYNETDYYCVTEIGKAAVTGCVTVRIKGYSMKKSTKTIFFILFCCILLLSGIWIYFQKSMEKVDLDGSGKNTVYKKHYVLIADDEKSLLWQSVYESAKAEAEKADAYLELIQPGENENYSQTDCLRISIASQVDGIILEPDGSDEVRALIDEAVTEGIPVIAVLEDDSESRRISFVGLNSYQMGDAYAEQVLKFLKDGETKIEVLISSEARDSGTNLIYSQIVRSLDQKKRPDQEISITACNIESSGDFTSEEAIRDIFLSQETLPDILICMDEVITECAYQALVDYNKVGDIDIIGFYYSGVILDAVQKGTVPATIALDTEEIGRYSVNALEEYLQLDHASNYYSVGLNVITKDNVSGFLKTEVSQEGQE